MGLLTDIGGITNTVLPGSKALSFGSDILTNLGKSAGILGTDPNKGNTLDEIKNLDISTIATLDPATKNYGDIRGIQEVFREKTYNFEYNKDFTIAEYDNYFSSENNKDYKNVIQDVILYEFQPYNEYEIGKIATQFNNLYGPNAKNDKSFEKAVDISVQNTISFLGLSKSVKNVLMDEIAENPSNFYAMDNTQTATNQNSQINHAFTHGKWLNTYTLPLFHDLSRPFYYNMDASDINWIQPGDSTSNTTSSPLDFIDQSVKNIRNLISSPIAATEKTLITTPIWNAKAGKQSASFNIRFSLINNHNIANTFNNYRFLQNFYSGTMPVAMRGSTMQAPNIYQVFLPGIGYYTWATISITITNLGKQKVLTGLNKKLLHEYSIKTIDVNKTMWPEAWDVDVNVKNLMPMSFTTYAYALKNGQLGVAGVRGTDETKGIVSTSAPEEVALGQNAYNSLKSKIKTLGKNKNE